MVQGRNTTSSTLINICRLFSESPSIVSELRGTDLKVQMADTTISMEMTKDLPLLNAVFNETVRMFPPVAADFRICIDDDVLPSGIEMKSGCRVFISNLAIGRDPSLWTEPNTFNPKRWISNDATGSSVLSLKRPDEYMLPVFWGGPRLCLGKDMARFEATIFVHRIFSRFNLKSLPGQEKKDFVTSPVIFYQGVFVVVMVRLTVSRLLGGWQVRVSEYVK